MLVGLIINYGAIIVIGVAVKNKGPFFEIVESYLKNSKI